MEMPLNSVFTFRLEYTHEGYADVAFNVLHYQLTAATVTGTGLPLATVPLAEDVLPQAAQELAEVYASGWQPFGSEDVGIIGGTTQKTYPGDRSAPYTYTFPAPQAGQVVSQSLPMQDAATILKKTGIGQRWGMGRAFIPGIPELHQDGGTLSTEAMDSLNDFKDVFSSTIVFSVGPNSYTIRPVVTNVPTTGFPRVNFVTSAQVSDNIIKSQRRRRPGKGQ